MPRSVLIPVDGSENSQRAFDFYVSEISHVNDMILLCHVQQSPTLPVVIMCQPLQDPFDLWISEFQEEVKKSQKIIAHYEMACDKGNMAKKVYHAVYYQ